MLTGLVTGQFELDSRVAEAMCRKVVTMNHHDTAAALPELFADGEIAIVVDDEQRVVAVVTKIDFVDYLTRVESLQRVT